MNWNKVLEKFADLPLFHSSMLRVFDDDPAHIQIQLSRWSRSGKLRQIRRSWYLIEEPYRRRDVSDALIANTVVQPSYLSLEWALWFHGLIPEAVFNPVSVTTARSVEFTAGGRSYYYHHVQPAFFTGYEQAGHGGEIVLVAAAEKALLDKIYLFMRTEKFSEKWLKSLRLQNLDALDIGKLESWAALTSKPGFAAAVRAAISFIQIIQKDGGESP